MAGRRFFHKKALLCILAVASLLSCKAFEGVQIEVNFPTEAVEPETAVPLDGTEAPRVDLESPGEPGNWRQATVTPGVGINQHFQPVDQIGGNTYAVAVSDRYAYLGCGPRILVWDLENPEAGIAGQSEPLPGVVRGIALHGNLAYVAAGKANLRVLDLSDPIKPVEIETLEAFQWAMALALDGDRLYVADNAQGLWIADISQPAQPSVLGTYQLKQPAAGLAVRDGMVYVVHMTGGMVALDVSNPAQPVLKAELNLPQMSSAVTLVGETAWVAAGTGGLWIVDISRPDSLVKVAEVPGTWADGIARSGDLVALSDMVTGLTIFDASNPVQPALLGSLPLMIFSQGVPGQRQMTLSNQRLALASPNEGLLLVDLSNPSKPALAARLETPLSGTAFDAQKAGETVYVTRDLIGLGSVLADPDGRLRFQTSEKSFTQGAPMRTSWKFAVQDGIAYLADANLGFRALDLTSFQQIGGLTTPKSWGSVVLQGSTAYATTFEHDPKPGDPEGERSLRVVSIANPLQPRQLGFLRMANNAKALWVEGNLVYYPDQLEIQQLKGGKAGLHVIDVSNPASPVQIGEADSTEHCPQATSLVLKEDYLFVGDLNQTICIFDVSDPASPRLALAWKEGPQVYDLALAGERIFIAGYAYVGAVNITNPTAPVLEDITVTPGLAWGIDVDGDLVLVADMDGGLNVLRYR